MSFIIEEYQRHYAAILERIHHIDHIFSSIDEERVWWYIETYIAYDIAWGFYNDEYITISWDSEDYDDYQIGQTYSIPMELFVSGSDEELSSYIHTKMQQYHERELESAVVTLKNTLEQYPEIYDFIKSYNGDLVADSFKTVKNTFSKFKTNITNSNQER